MSEKNQDEQLPEGVNNARDVRGESKDDKVLTSAQEKTQSKPRRYRHLLKKMAATAVQSAAEEYLASFLARDRGKLGHFYTHRTPKNAVYGSLIHVPLTNWLLKWARHLFRGRTSPISRFLAILFGLLVVAPIQRTIFCLSGAIIAGARTFHQVRATVRAGFSPAMKVVLLAFPIAVSFATNFLPERAWPKFFTTVNFAINTYANAHVKKIRLAALRRKHFGEPVVVKKEEDESDADSIPMPSTSRPTSPTIPRSTLVVKQGNGILDAPQSVIPTATNSIYAPISPNGSEIGQPDVDSSSYLSYSTEEGEEIEPGQADVESYYSSNYWTDSSTDSEDIEPGARPLRTPSPFQLSNRPNFSPPEGESRAVPSARLSEAAAAAAEAIPTQTFASAGSLRWRRLARSSRDSASDSDGGSASEIDSDTSSDSFFQLLRYRLPRKYRR